MNQIKKAICPSLEDESNYNIKWSLEGQGRAQEEVLSDFDGGMEAPSFVFELKAQSLSIHCFYLYLLGGDGYGTETLCQQLCVH